VRLVWDKKLGRGGAASILLGAAFLLSLSCGPSRTAPGGEGKRYKLTGRVVSVDSGNQSVVVDGDDIPGFMSAMTMAYKVKNQADLNKLAAGDRLSADIVGGNDQYWLENVSVLQHGAMPAAKPSATLRIPESGDAVPNFALVNQNGKPISLSQYRGKALILTFIYTRCPFPDFCPRVSGEFAEMDHKLAGNSELYRQTHLLSISFDPVEDTPKALRDYGSTYLGSKPGRFDHWEFAVPPAAELPRIAAYFALAYSNQGGTLTHSLSTAVIGPDGRIFRWYHGNDWTSSDLIKDAALALHNAG
jgi:protein SCO1/2